ncbi:hypothetical protein CTEN210_08002 [Chaetoceros tenuissimus]|uniref:RING-type E3 ubiquitin transferase n=1 Tax=Chaetoceros tenuissimus TaxID=426638 RepID=A0AAD3H5Z3_9STRA|nr:hypothetical protein CTEN210_08002 [Chaetoceros tenuissimus]
MRKSPVTSGGIRRILALLLFLRFPNQVSAYIYNHVTGWYYHSIPAVFGTEIRYDDIVLMNLFLPPLELDWNLCNITDLTNEDSFQEEKGEDNVSDTNQSYRGFIRSLYSQDYSDMKNLPSKPLDFEVKGITRRARGDDDKRKETDFEIFRRSIGLLVTRGDCSFQEKAINAEKLNEYFLENLKEAYNITEDGSFIEPEYPVIKYLIVVNNVDNSPFGMSKDDEKKDVNIGLLGIGETSGNDLKSSMAKRAVLTGDIYHAYLDVNAFLPLDSSFRDGSEWLYPMSADGKVLHRGITMARLMMVFILVIIMFPILRLLLYCVLSQGSFEWRRNENGRINGIRWRRIRNAQVPMNWGDFGASLIGNLRGERNTEIHTLTAEEVQSLPLIKFGVDDLNVIINQYYDSADRPDTATSLIVDECDEGKAINDDTEQLQESDDSNEEGVEGTKSSNDLNSEDNVQNLDNNLSMQVLENSQDDKNSVAETVDIEKVPLDDSITDDIESKSLKSTSKEENDVEMNHKVDFVQAAFNSCESCSICICEYDHGEELRLLPVCGHIFHTECIVPWLTEKRNTCPLCQQKVEIINKAENDDCESTVGAQADEGSFLPRRSDMMNFYHRRIASAHQNRNDNS